jgi:tRNA U38,U39,U40 pseudouridine synthase TruA
MSAFADLEKNENPHCQIYHCQSAVCENVLLLRATARFFLRKQVRRMVGATIHCSVGNADILQIRKDLLRPSPDATLFWAERAAPASGLFLEYVQYPGDDRPCELRPILRILK